MKTIDATPTVDFSKQAIVMDGETAARHADNVIVIPLVLFALVYEGSALLRRRAEKRIAEGLTATLGENQRMAASSSQSVGRGYKRGDAVTYDDSLTQRVGALNWVYAAAARRAGPRLATEGWRQ